MVRQAKKEEVMEIRKVAEAKLKVFHLQIPPLEYEKLTEICMHEIAEDLDTALTFDPRTEGDDG